MRKTAIFAAVGALALSACSNAAQPSSSESGQGGDGLNVIAAFYPLQWTAERIVGEHGEVTSLTTPGAEPHDLELTPQQIASLSEADLVLYVEGMQPAVNEAIAQSGATALNVADAVTLMPAEEHEHDEADEASSASASPNASQDAASEEHDHGDLDPHFWLDPSLMGTFATSVGKRLGEIDSANADAYTKSAEALVGDLNTLDQEYQTGLTNCARREFITTHQAFSYLAKRYNLEEIGISGINPDEEPSPARIAEIQEEAKAHNVTTIFFETLTSDAVAQAIAGDLGLKTAVLDPLEGVTDNSPGTDYPSIMRANLSALVEANECTS